MSFDGVTRRGALLGAAGLGVAACSEARLEALPLPPGPFKHGVASGDPDQTSLVVWTAVTEPVEGVPVMLELATDAQFAVIVQRAAMPPVSPSSGRSVPHKRLISGLEPGTEYFFRFQHAGETSPVGRTKTLPEGAVERFEIAAFSCANYPAGFFNAYRDAANHGGLDLVLHLGDYLYEYGLGGYATERADSLARVPDPVHEILSEDDYARRHAQYAADPDLQALKASAPWILIWDDHETANDAFSGGAQNHNDGEGEWTTRRDGALRAYFAWLPVRQPDPAYARFGAVEIGDLATLIFLETRLLARSETVDWSSFPVPVDADPDDPAVAEAVQRWRDEVVGDPARELLGAEQLVFVGAALARSQADGKPWRVLANQVIMGRTDAPDYTVQTPWWLRFGMRLSGGYIWEYAQRTHLGVPMTTDAWDGFPAERERLYAAARAANADFLVLTGDTHNAWCLDLHDASGTRVGTEFGVTSVTSPSEFEFVTAPGVDFGRMTEDRNAEVLRHNAYDKGYLRLTLTPQAAEAELVTLSTISARTFTSAVDSRWRVTPAMGGPVPQVERVG